MLCLQFSLLFSPIHKYKLYKLIVVVVIKVNSLILIKFTVAFPCKYAKKKTSYCYFSIFKPDLIYMDHF